MIAVDTSALVAVVLGEPDAERYLGALQDNPTSLSLVSLVEAGMVVEARQGPDAARDLRILVDGTIERLVPVDADQAQAAVNGWRRFGKGRHPAGLNFGDCFSYAVARLAGVPLLFKGDDFSQSDVASVF
ncbi:MAG: type II toxin-antitoxin system VapC family toxin [Pseudonocardia sp.]